MTFSSGYKIGAYTVVRPLGQGGTGDVYEVEHERLGTRYALKVLTAGESCDGLLKNKFLAEGKLLARLKDPRVVRVFDLDIDERSQLPYFVMDLLKTDKIVVTFSEEMEDGCWSVCCSNDGTWDDYPKCGKISYDASHTVLTIPVSLVPGKTYKLQLNNGDACAFMNKAGKSLMDYIPTRSPPRRGKASTVQKRR